MKRLLAPSIDTILVLLIAIGVSFRFCWRDWSQGTNLHPDEYGLTNTLTQLRLPESVADYFNTRISPLSPYQKYDLAGLPMETGPDNRMRWGQWPIIIIRSVAELSAATGYDEMRLMGRSLSAFADTMTLLVLFLIGRRVFPRRVALTATSLSSLSALQIQQSHFMTVDNFAVFFSMLAMYTAVEISRGGLLHRSDSTSGDDTPKLGAYKPKPRAVGLFALYGIALGMAVASRVNLLPLGTMVLLASMVGIADLRLSSRSDLWRIGANTLCLVAFSAILGFLTFRVTQPMSFRARSGNTTVLTITLNPDWVDSMNVARNESSGIGGGPPAEQWANRPIVVFPLVNMIVWGMGLPLGIACWMGVFGASRAMIRGHKDWRTLLPLLAWVTGYFFFMATRWVKSMRYFLPIYPLLCLFAAWLLIDLSHRSNAPRRLPEVTARRVAQVVGRFFSLSACPLVVLGTFFWAAAFVDAVYSQDHTRIEASRWIYQNIPRGSVIANETWDEGLPLPVDGLDPLGQNYEGLAMEIRWPDIEEKRQMMIDILARSDVIILPSQRAIWSTARLPLNYPMTMEYYRALFDGRLGFDLSAVFSHPLRIGPLIVSDVGGTIAFNNVPDLPLFNYSILAAEEAFSVYDHPPVWIFTKRDDFDLQHAIDVLNAVDLSRVTMQSPRDVPASLY